MKFKISGLVLSFGLLVGTCVIGCGEPKDPPPGATTEGVGAPPEIDLGTTPSTDVTAPTEDKGAPTNASPENESSADAPGEK